MKLASLQQIHLLHKGKVTDKWSLHLEVYARVFDPLRSSPVRLLEMGVQNGGSLEVWAEYFDQASSIVGCDVDPVRRSLSDHDPRISVVVGDADTEIVESALCERGAPFDVVIDARSHASNSVVRAFARYFAHLSDGGIYVVEDRLCSDRQASQKGFSESNSSMAFFKKFADLISYEYPGSAARQEVLREFSRAHSLNFDEALLSQVHSIEFLSAMCIVRKKAARVNVLGDRVVSGSRDAAVSGVRERDGTLPELMHEDAALQAYRSSAPDTPSAPFDRQQEQMALLAARLSAATSERYRHSSRIIELEIQLEKVSKAKALSEAAHAAEVDHIYRSSSWRVTAPLRWAKTQVLSARSIVRLLPDIFERHGGAVGALRRGVEIFRESGFAGLNRSANHALSPVQDYDEWVRRYDTLDDEKRASLLRMVEVMPRRPLISIVMPTYNPNPLWLAKAIESVQAQIYPAWELCIADDASPDPACCDVLRRFAAQDPRIKVVYREKNGHISAASNSALALATGEWTALMDHDDTLPEHALLWVADAINTHPDARLIYSDEDKIDGEGHRSGPYFKSDWNPDLFYSQNMFSHLGVFHTSLLREVGGFRLGMEGSQDYDLVLRCIERVAPMQVVHIPRVLYHWRVHAESTAGSTDAKPYAQIAGERALNEHFQRTGIKGRVEFLGYGYRAHYDLPVPAPLVSLIIPTRNAASLVRQCIESIESLTTYSNYEIILVDNGSDQSDAVEYFDALSLRSGFKVIRDASEFNYSALNNKAVAQASGQLVGLINNDIEVISPDWLSEMVSIALQPGIGAVGARLWYPDGTLQHGGVVLGIGGVASHAHKALPRGNRGYFGRADLIQSFSAVTAACLVVRKDHYEAVGGLDEVNLTVAFNDVDFCLRLRKAGLRNVWTPYAELFHHESATRGTDVAPEKQARFNREVDYMRKTWGALLSADPAYNPNLSLVREDFSFAWPPRI